MKNHLLAIAAIVILISCSSRSAEKQNVPAKTDSTATVPDSSKVIFPEGQDPGAFAHVFL